MLAEIWNAPFKSLFIKIIHLVKKWTTLTFSPRLLRPKIICTALWYHHQLPDVDTRRAEGEEQQ